MLEEGGRGVRALEPLGATTADVRLGEAVEIAQRREPPFVAVLGIPGVCVPSVWALPVSAGFR